MSLDIQQLEQIGTHLLHPHPYNQKIYGNEDVSELADRIEASGWIKPLVVTQDNRIISGHRRWQAAISLARSEVPAERRIFANEMEELEALLLENASRDKTPEQKVREAGYWKEVEDEKARQRMSEAAKAQRQGSENFRTPEYGRTTNKVAERVGFGSGRNYEKATQVVIKADQLKEQGKVEEGQALLNVLNTRSVDAASKIVKLAELEQITVLETIASGKTVKEALAEISSSVELEDEEETTLPVIALARDVAMQISEIDVQREQRREERREQIAQLREKGVDLPVGKFSCLVIDPPWPMQKIERDVRPNQVEFDYPTMSEEELKAFPLPDITADNCHLYLWTTQKYLPMALRLAEHWGFKYQCLMTWVKNVGFTPYSRMYSTEHVLFCTKGSLPLLKIGTRLDFMAKVREHSRKPDEFYEIVKLVSPGPRIDIFSREKREGFEQYGNEVEKFV